LQAYSLSCQPESLTWANGTMDPDEEAAPLLNERVSSAIINGRSVLQERPMQPILAVLMIGFFTAVFVIVCLAPWLGAVTFGSHF
jgi:hypothetical protein